MNRAIHSSVSLPIRIAGPGDREAVLGLIRLLHKENGLFSLSEEKIQWHVDRAIAQDGAIIGVMGPSDNMVAGIYIDIERPYYSDDLQLTELFNFVHPAHRKSEHGRNLIRFAMKLSEEWGIPFVTGVLSTDRTAAKVRMYRQMLPEIGAYFCYRPSSMSEQKTGTE